MREFDNKLSFTKGIDNCINDPRNQFLIIHEQEELLRQRIFQIALGYEDADDSDLLRLDPLFMISVKNKKAEELASQPTITRLENRITKTELDSINTFLLNNYIQYATTIKENKTEPIVIDMDSTDDPTYGNQQMSMFHGYYEQNIYHPLLVFENTSKLLLGAFLRPGNVHTADNAMEHLSPIITKVKSSFSGKELIFRADSGFSSPKTYDYCNSEGISFVVGVPSNNVLIKKIDPYLELARKRHKEKNEKVLIFVSFRYKASTWSRQQKMVAKIEINSHKEDIRFITTNMKGKAKDIYEFYTGRGDSENRIEELKNGFKADRLSCHEFNANYFRLLLHSCAYNFISLLRNIVDSNSALAQAKIDTFRLKLLKVGAWINETTRRIWVRFSTAWPYRNMFLEIYEKIKVSPQFCLA